MADKAVMTLFCRSCDSPNHFTRRWIEDDDECTTCGARGQWRTLNEPRTPYELNHNDKAFLRSIRVQSDQ
jgi:hypothetical protein